MEAIHIELANEAVDLIVPEELWEDDGLELENILNDKLLS